MKFGIRFERLQEDDKLRRNPTLFQSHNENLQLEDGDFIYQKQDGWCTVRSRIVPSKIYQRDVFKQKL